MRLTFAELSLPTLKTLVQFHERGVVPAHWEQMQAPLTAHEQQQLAMVTAYLLNYQLNLMNEATIWSRAIYPLLREKHSRPRHKDNRSASIPLSFRSATPAPDRLDWS